MELLFRRKQTSGKLSRVNFTLWGKIELTEDEQQIVKRYRFDDAVLIVAFQPLLLRAAAIIAGAVFLLAFAILSAIWNMSGGFIFGLVAGGAAGYWYINEKRETIFVKDLLHGRNFKCESVVELARKEAWLGTIVGFLRQVMESAKHWDGTETLTIEPLSKEDAKQFVIKGL